MQESGLIVRRKDQDDDIVLFMNSREIGRLCDVEYLFRQNVYRWMLGASSITEYRRDGYFLRSCNGASLRRNNRLVARWFLTNCNEMGYSGIIKIEPKLHDHVIMLILGTIVRTVNRDDKNC